MGPTLSLVQLETAIAQATTLTEPDVGLITCKVVTSTLIDEGEATLVGGETATPPVEPEVQFWHTSQGKFRFTLEELPAQLQIIYSLMSVRDGDDSQASPTKPFGSRMWTSIRTPTSNTSFCIA